jgi:hypothetical protein
MAFGFRFSLRSDQWRRVSNEMIRRLQEPDSEYTKKIFQITAGGIVKRTKSGIDVAGVTFKPYSPGYAAKKGYSAADLTVSGRLISQEGFDFEVLGGRGKIYIRIFVPKKIHAGKVDHYTLASVHNFGGRSGRGKGFQMPKREFFGMSEAIAMEIESYTKEEWRKLFKTFSG